jgi:hypothetical protein
MSHHMFSTKLHVDFLINSEKSVGGFARLKLKLPFAPTPSMEFEQPVWHSSRKVASVSWNIEDETFFVALEPDVLNSPDDLKQHLEMYDCHGWKVNSPQLP